MARRREGYEKSALNPMFYLPEGLDEFYYSESPDGEETNIDLDELNPEELDDSDVEDDDLLVDDDTEFADIVDTPNEFTIVQQIIRLQPNGMQVVDLIVDVETIPGAINYEFRVVKV